MMKNLQETEEAFAIRMGIPTEESRELYLKEAPDEEPLFGQPLESRGGFDEEIVWVETPEYRGLGYCDEAEPLGPKDPAAWEGVDEDEIPEDAWAYELIVYAEEPLREPYYRVAQDNARLATKAEVNVWFDLQAKLKAVR